MPIPGQPYNYNPAAFAIMDPSMVTGDRIDPSSLETPVVPSGNPYPQSANGWAKLGFMVTPAGRQAVRAYGQDIRNKAALAGMLENLRAQNLQNEISKGDQQLAARRNLSAYYQSLGESPNVADAHAGIEIAAGNFEQGAKATGEYQNQDFKARAAQDFANNNPSSANQNIALATGKLIPNRAMSGGVAYSPYGASADFQVAPTGQADIAAKNAAASRSRAGAGAEGKHVVIGPNGQPYVINAATGTSTQVSGPAIGKPSKASNSAPKGQLSAADSKIMQDAGTLISSGRATQQQVIAHLLAKGRADLAADVKKYIQNPQAGG